jgi:DNA-binding LacI/PurR family transcriptional regulator
VFAADDLIGMGALSAALASVLPARFTAPPLTTVRQDAMAMGERAIEVIATPEDERPRGRVVLPVSLVVRRSTGLPPNGSAAAKEDSAWNE